MKLALFGATGATGQAIQQLAKLFGCELSMHSRQPGLEGAVVGEIADVADEVLAGCEAVVICLGARRPYTDVFLADATTHIVEACKRQGVQRLICVTGALAGEYPSNQGKAFRWVTKTIFPSTKATLADKAAQEAIVKNSGLNWTIIKPPRLTDNTRQQHYIAGSTIHCGLFSSISRRTLAYDIGKCINNEATFQMVRFIKSIKD
ncbi:NAD(P)-dependent oxidoreductase [Salinibius halmophilus]|uniref:NAD(P)-dependent oxidoreductase n=1 Tax=Salinibius halmophilus TaxID=1853216 RepID=UPI000E675390|nr:NAD(P)H-binding protein [Salinibius halmophilus]